MGIPGILKEIGKGERTALSKLAIEHFERHNRPLRIAIDAAIWNFQTASGQGGKNPALRTLFFRLLRLLALPIQPVFVYDGKNKPLTKRGRTVNGYRGTCVPNELSKGLVSQFCYPWHVAPGEAEAECAFLQKKGIVDMVMSQDADAIMFGAGVTLRDWSKEGTRGNKAPTHVNVMSLIKLKEISGLDSDGMILVALLSGGDYDEAGVAGFGATLACEVARAGFGKDLIELVNKQDSEGLREWRERLQYELETNESGYFKRRHKKLTVPDTFPDLKILGYYTKPAVSSTSDLPDLEAKWTKLWQSKIDVPSLRNYTGNMFDWCWRSGARRFVRCFAQPLFQSRLIDGNIDSTPFSIDSISERRQHFINDGVPELRFSAVPADVVGIDIDAEQENPEYTTKELGDGEGDDDPPADIEEDNVELVAEEQPNGLSSSTRRKKSQPWDAYAPEKWWIPETLLQLGLPQLVEDWHQLQRDIRADPKKFATRKIRKVKQHEKQIDGSMRTGAIHGFFTNVIKQARSKDGSQLSSQDNTTLNVDCAVLGVVTSNSIPDPLAPAHPQADVQGGDTNSLSLTDLDTTVSPQGLATTLSQKHARPPTSESSQTSPSTRRHRAVDHSHNITGNNTSSNPSQSCSFSNTILRDSSPLVEASSNSPAEQDRMEHVTQRRSRRVRTRLQRTSSSLASSPMHTRRPIESFFTHSKEDFLGDVKGSSLAQDTTVDLPSASSPSISRKLRSTALVRESLPGSWKEAATDSAPIKRAPRISYVDLTSD